jgi:phosphate transport system substrate-binding protein
MKVCRVIKNLSSLMILAFCLSILGCKSYRSQEEEQPDTSRKGRIIVSADESFKPIIDAQVQVYEANYPLTKIVVHYKPEAECFKDLFVDSIRIVIATRSYTSEEKAYLVDSMGISPESMVVARDAITVIVNPAAPDSMFTMQDIIAILKGRFSKNLIPVFDGVKATSTVRFVIDSVLRGDSLSSKATAARSSRGVIDYVAQNQDVLGFIGVSWIGNPEDTAEISFLKKVRMASIQSTDNLDWFVKPSQANIYIKRYPMVRDLVYILKENYHGLGHGFADFMSGEIGQLIFKRAYLMPMQKNFGIRPVRLKE